MESILNAWYFKQALSQTLDWAKSFGANGCDEGWSLAFDDYGNIYMTGSFRSMVDFDPTPGTYYLDSNWHLGTMVLKLNSDGALSLGRKDGRYQQSIHTCRAGHIILS